METDGNRLYGLIIILVISLFVKAIYSTIEYALFEVNEGKIKSLAEKDNKYNPLLDLITFPQKTMIAFSIHKAISNIIISVVCILLFLDNIINFLARYIENKTLNELFSVCLMIFFEIIVLVVFTDILPSKIALKNVDNIALKSVRLVKFLIGVVTPISMIVNGISFVIGKIFKLDNQNSQEKVTEEDILMMVDETGDIEDSQKDMINNIFEFGDVTIPDVMTHRKDIIAVDVKSKIADIVYIAINEGFSRIPVYQENIDNIIGIIYVKDLLCLVGCQHLEDFEISHFIRQAMYISEYSKCSEIFETMTIKKYQMAIVVDEYGGTAGLVTMEDLIEEIVGNIQDEYDEEHEEIDEISDGVFIIDGSTNIDDVCSMLNIELPQEHNYDTMSAFIVDLIGHIPHENEISTVKYQDVVFTVLLVEENWISKIKAIVKR